MSERKSNDIVAALSSDQGRAASSKQPTKKAPTESSETVPEAFMKAILGDPQFQEPDNRSSIP